MFMASGALGPVTAGLHVTLAQSLIAESGILRLKKLGHNVSFRETPAWHHSALSGEWGMEHTWQLEVQNTRRNKCKTRSLYCLHVAERS